MNDLRRIDPDLKGLQSMVPDLSIGPSDHIRITALLTALIDKDAAPESRDALGPLIAPLLARDEVQQEQIHRFYAQAAHAIPEADVKSHNEVETASHDGHDAEFSTPLSARIRIWSGLIGLLIAGLAAIAVLTNLPLTNTGSLPVVVTNPTLNVPPWVEWVVSLVRGFFSWVGGVRGMLVAIPLIVATWFILRLLDRSAVLDANLMRTDNTPKDIYIPANARRWLLAAPKLKSSLGRLRLYRTSKSLRIDMRATAETAARHAGRVISVQHETRRRGVEHLVLIDRLTLSDHLGLLGDTLVDRMKDAGVPTHAFDLLRDPTRAASPGKLLDETQRITLTRDLALTFQHDAIVVIADAARLLNTTQRRLADWLRPFEDRAMVTVMTPRPRGSWGRAEQALIRQGLALFPLTDDGVNAYVVHRVASFADLHRPATAINTSIPAWTIDDAVHAIEEGDRDSDKRSAAAFALQAALGPSAFRLLSVLALFPVVLPELTLRMCAALNALRSDDVVRLSALPGFRDGHLPFWLRRELAIGLPPEDRARARTVIRNFQDELRPTTSTERSLSVARHEEGLLSFLRSFGPGARQEMMNDALFVRFVQGEDDFSSLALEAKGSLRDVLTPRLRQQIALVALAGLLGTLLSWVAAQTILHWIAETSFGFLAADPLANRGFRLSLIMVSLVLYWLITSGYPKARNAFSINHRAAALPLIPVLVHDFCAVVAKEVGNSAGVAVDLAARWDILAIFIFLVVLQPRRRLAVDLVSSSAAISVVGLLVGFVALVTANIATACVQAGFANPVKGDIFTALALIGLVLAASVLTRDHNDAWPYFRDLGRTIWALLPLCLAGGAAWGVFDHLLAIEPFVMPLSRVAGFCAAILFAVLPLLYRWGLIGPLEWLAGIGGCALLYILPPSEGAIEDQFVTLKFLSSFAPALAILFLGGLLLRKQMDPPQFARNVTNALLIVFPLPALASLGLADSIASFDLDSTTLLYASGYFALVIVIGQFLWLRHLAFTSDQEAPNWREGPMAAVLFIPVILACGFSAKISDAWAISLIFVAMFLTITLPARFGFWAAVSSIAALILVACGQTGIAPGVLFGGMGPSSFGLSLLLMRIVSERGFLTRLLAVDGIRFGQYMAIIPFFFLVIGYQIPEIGLRFEFGGVQFLYLGLIVLGLSRIKLREPAAFVIFLTGSASAISTLLDQPWDGLYLLSVYDAPPTFVLWSLLVVGIARAIRTVLVADLGDDPVAYDGWLMGNITRICQNPWILVAVGAVSVLSVDISLFGQDQLKGAPSDIAIFALAFLQPRPAPPAETHRWAGHYPAALLVLLFMSLGTFAYYFLQYRQDSSPTIEISDTVSVFSRAIVTLPLYFLLVLGLGQILRHRSRGMRNVVLMDAVLWNAPEPAPSGAARQNASSDDTVFVGLGRHGRSLDRDVSAQRGIDFLSIRERILNAIQHNRSKIATADVRYVFGSDNSSVRGAWFDTLVPPGWQSTLPAVSGRSFTALDPTLSRVFSTLAGLVFAVILVAAVYVARS